MNMRDYTTLHLDMDVNEHERLFNFTLRHKLKQRNSVFIAICIKPHR